jgi:putative methanogenesis marker protein 8
MKPKNPGLVGEHEFRCCGARTLVRNGEIEVLTEPTISHCPLHQQLYGTGKIDKESVKRSVEMKIRGFGFCCGHRTFDGSLIVPFGSSEIISVCLKKGLLDCAVTVCDGAGTVIASDPGLVQGIGARLTGIVRTSPIRSTIEYITTHGGVVLDEESARIDQAEGVIRAIGQGYRRVAVTVAGYSSHSIDEIRMFQENAVQVSVLSICNTCAGEADANRILRGADVVCASASALIREKVGPKALMQLGLTIPVFALTRNGKMLLLSYLMESNENIVAFRSRGMPYAVEGKGPELRE